MGARERARPSDEWGAQGGTLWRWRQDSDVSTSVVGAAELRAHTLNVKGRRRVHSHNPPRSCCLPSHDPKHFRRTTQSFPAQSRSPTSTHRECVWCVQCYLRRPLDKEQRIKSAHRRSYDRAGAQLEETACIGNSLYRKVETN
jgi:hypothetical protein